MEEIISVPEGFEGLSSTLLKALRESLNIFSPTPIQAQAIPLLVDTCGGDVVMQAQTGSGKTLAYALPLLNMILGNYQAPKASNQENTEKFETTRSSSSNTNVSSFREDVGTIGLIIVPTRELAVQTQVTLTKILSRIRPHWMVTTALTGGDSRKSEKARLRRGCQIVVGTPGRLLDHLKTSEGWRRHKLSWLVIDEADRLADLGFEATVKEIFSTLAMAMGRLRMVLVSATVTEKLKFEFAGRKLKNPKFVKTGGLKKEIYDDKRNNNNLMTNQNASEDQDVEKLKDTETEDLEYNAPVAIDQSYLHIPTKLRLQVLAGLLRSFFPVSGASQSCRVIVFFSCCDSVDFHFDLFRVAGENKTIPALLPPRVKLLRLHGNLEQSNRVATFNDFIKEGKSTSTESIHTILFCTDVAARGLDFPNLAGSIQYDAPCDIHDYIHRAGRTGRLSAAKSPEGAIVSRARSIIFLMPSEEAYVQRLTSMGMKSLRKQSFDDYLKWVEKLDVKKLQSLLGPKTTYKSSKDRNGDGDALGDSEEPIIANLPSTLKSRLGLLQKVIEAGIAGNPELSSRARDGFLSTCRAYATHPSAEKDIFHIKRLHLGHLAAAFGLDREPKKMLNGHAANKANNASRMSRDQVPADIAQGSSKMRKELRESNYLKHQQRQQQATGNDKKFNNRLNFNNSQKRSNSINSLKQSKEVKRESVVYEEDEVVFAY